jgi:hypothetical protein
MHSLRTKAAIALTIGAVPLFIAAATSAEPLECSYPDIAETDEQISSESFDEALMQSIPGEQGPFMSLPDDHEAIPLNNLPACIAACNGGLVAVEKFCLGLPDMRMKAICMAMRFGSTIACINWCNWHYTPH